VSDIPRPNHGNRPERDRPIRVYIVEDDEIALGRFAAAVKADPRTELAGTAASGAAALFALPTVNPDVLLIDLGLPDMDGRDVIRKAAKSIPACDIMVVTVFGDEAHVLSSIEAGATGYVLKEADRGELVEHIVELRAGGSPITPVIARRLLGRMREAAASEREAAATEQVSLTGRETEILKLMSKGFTYVEIAEQLGISANTVKSHVKTCYQKLSVNSAAAAVMRANESGLLRNEPPGRR
jgi:DNA-binding NarL/FixJ family response regulator